MPTGKLGTRGSVQYVSVEPPTLCKSRTQLDAEVLGSKVWALSIKANHLVL